MTFFSSSSSSELEHICRWGLGACWVSLLGRIGEKRREEGCDQWNGLDTNVALAA